MKQVFRLEREQSIIPNSGEAYTLGKLYLNGVFFCYTCEDMDRKLENGGTKVYGQTAIPRGLYQLSVTFSNRFQKPLPYVNDVPGFDGIRIHSGNRAEDSHGCILVGKVRAGNGVAQCSDTVQRVIRAIENADDKGDKIYLEVV